MTAIVPIGAAPMLPFSQQKSEALFGIDSSVDALYGRVIGNRASEYELAEKEATQFAAAGYTGNVPQSVSSWAAAKNESAQWAADNILAAAQGWRNVQRAIRAERLAKKEALRATQNQAELLAVMRDWNAFIFNMYQQLGT